jgi:mRNA-degrading endonuclease RelE of RelBE toxin-antitoxin system
MVRRVQFSLQFAPETIQHLRTIDRKYHPLIRDALRAQLIYPPEQETRNCRLLRPPAPFAATWELRFGPNNRFRVFFDVDEQAQVVRIVAIGAKEGNRLFIGHEEFEL